ncbi:MAG: glycosyltransferase family 39 protein, partial [Candidatus Auribacterota bacterium]|nr:glycosyltransferase family 39 protein [Candidatus Auribacterota bacterium]
MNRKYELIILAGILVLGAVVRLWGIDYGLPCTYCRPDEDRLISTALRLSLQDPNPHLFDWPGLFFYLTRGILEITGLLVGWWQGFSTTSPRILYPFNPTSFHLSVRLVFAGMGTATIYFLYLLGKKLFGRTTGFLASFFLALSFLHARESHFGMLDVPVTLFSLIFFLRALKLIRLGRWRDYLGCGLWAGLAFATKYYAVILLIPLLTAHLLRFRGKGWKRYLSSRVVAAVLLTFIIFLIVSPYTLLDFKSFYHDVSIKWIDQYYQGHLPIPEVRTMRGWLYHLVFSLRYALGWG